MIRYALRCAERHDFEMWFRDSATYDRLAADALVTCPECGSSDVDKRMMAPSVSAPRPAEPKAAPDPAPREMMRQIRAFREHVLATTQDVGRRFPQEARDMHEGIADSRPIRGEATPEEAKALRDEGIPILPLPPEPPKEN